VTLATTLLAFDIFKDILSLTVLGHTAHWGFGDYALYKSTFYLLTLLYKRAPGRTARRHTFVRFCTFAGCQRASGTRSITRQTASHWCPEKRQVARVRRHRRVPLADSCVDASVREAGSAADRKRTKYQTLDTIKKKVERFEISLRSAGRKYFEKRKQTGSSMMPILHCESKKLGHFFTAYNFRNIERTDLYQIWHKSLSLHAEHHAIIYLNQPWKIVAPSGE